MSETSRQFGRNRLSRRQGLTFLAALLLVTSHFSLAYISDTAPFLSLRAFAAGQESQPFQERALMGWLLRATGRLDSPGLEVELHRLLPAMGSGFNEITLVLLVVAWLSMAASIVITRETLMRLTGDAPFSSWAAFFVPYMAYFTYILNFGPHFLLPYDLPSLFFFCAGLYLLVMRRPLQLIPLISIATLNRETSLFLIVFYVVFELSRPGERNRRGAVFVYAAGMLAAWAAMRLVVLHLYGHNPIAGASSLADLLVCNRWLQPNYLRRGLMVVALWFVLMLFVGVLIEIRIFGELISYMSVALGVILYRRLSLREDAAIAA